METSTKSLPVFLEPPYTSRTDPSNGTELFIHIVTATPQFIPPSYRGYTTASKSSSVDPSQNLLRITSSYRTPLRSSERSLNPIPLNPSSRDTHLTGYAFLSKLQCNLNLGPGSYKHKRQGRIDRAAKRATQHLNVKIQKMKENV